jgi:hypothetical protein
VRIFRRVNAVISATAIAASGVAGCAGSSPPAHTAHSVGLPLSPSAGPRTVLTPTPMPAPSLSAEARLRSALLQASDLGPSFSEVTSAGGGSASVKVTGCPSLATSINSSPGAQRSMQQSASFSGGSFGPFVEESLTALPAAEMGADYARMRAAIASCHFLGFAGYGQTMMFKLTPVSFGPPGSSAVRMDADFQGVLVDGYLAIDRIGNVALVYIFYQFESRSPQPANTFYVRAVGKARRVL